jgi:hypothetical protein
MIWHLDEIEVHTFTPAAPHESSGVVAANLCKSSLFGPPPLVRAETNKQCYNRLCQVSRSPW